jgi:hypothetical protein
MKRTKRKYIRKAATTPVESSRDGIESEGSVFPQVSISGGIPEGMVLPDSVTTTTGGEFTYIDLPLSVRMGVENTLKMRARLKLPDDSEERKARAIKMFRGDKAR